MKTRLKLWAALVLCLCALLVCGCALAEGQQYTASVANFGQLVPNTCERIVLYDRSNEYISEEGGSLFVEPTKMIGVRIYPQANCSVVSVVCNKEDYGVSSSLTLDLQSIDGGVSTWFTMPFGNVSLEITMAVIGVVRYEASFTSTGCDSATLTSSGGETGSTVQAAAGETIAITVVPLQGYDQLAMSYTTRSNPVSVPLVCARNEDGSFTAEVVMPDEPLYITAEASMTPVRYISYDKSGNLLGEKECTTYRKITSGNPTWLDLDDSLEGWYVVDANVTLGSDATIRVTGNVKLLLCDGVTLTVGNGIYIRKGSSLSIYGQSGGTGKLVSKPGHGPGIGGMKDTVGGSLYVHGGIIDAKGGTNAAGIGGGNHASGYENIVIYGGTVTAQGGSSGAGIGKGQQNSPSDCGLIAIYGGTVNATGGSYGAGIGGGEDRDGGTIRIYGGKVTAQGGHDGAGIGGGEDGSGGDILITGGTVYANGGDNSAGIGGGEKGDAGVIAIRGGTVTGIGAGFGGYGAGIGSGKNGGSSGSITIDGGTVTGYCEQYHGTGAGIGGGENSSNPQITITGGLITATGETGIGAGHKKDQDGGIFITGGEIHANGNWGAGIGGGGNNSEGDSAGRAGTIRISNALVLAHSHKGAGIGSGGAAAGGRTPGSGSITILNSVVCAVSTQKGAGIGGGNGGHGCPVTISDSMVVATGGSLNYNYLEEDKVTASIRGPARGLQKVGNTAYALMDNYCYNKISDLVMQVVFSGEFGGAGIGGGDDGNGGSVTIINSSVYASAGRSTCAAIGRGDGGGSNGSLSISSEAMVQYHDSSVEGYVQAVAGGRVFMCQYYESVEILPCEHAHWTYEVTESGHTMVCNHCLTAFEEEPHTYENGVCTVCDYAGTSVTVTYLPGHSYATGEMAPDGYVPSSTHPVAGCAYEVSGYEFAGWRVNDTDEVLTAGQQYTFNTDLTLTATWRNEWTDLQVRIENAGSGEVIALSADAVASVYDGALSIPAGKSVTLDLNGYILSRGLNAATVGGHVIINDGTLVIRDSAGGGEITGGWNSTQSQGGGIKNYGSLTLESGTITGNQGYMAGAVLNNASAVFTMTGGAITGNTCRQGGGGAVVNYGTMTMTGGAITGNVSGQNGGGVWNKGTLTVSGGSISGNTAEDKGGGIYERSDGILNLSGAPVIAGNSTTGRGVNNLHLNDDGGVLAVIHLSDPADGLHIGLSSSVLPSAEAPVILLTGVSGVVSGFTSDMAGCIVITENGMLELAVAPAFGTPGFTLPAGLTAVEAEAFEGIAAGVVEIPASCESIGDHAFRNCTGLTQIRIPAGCALGQDVFDGCTLVYVYGTAGSSAEAYCQSHENCVFVPVE